MASIKLANGTAVKELRMWDGAKWVGKRGRVRNGTGWAEFIRPILTFQDDNATQSGMSKQSANTLVKASLSVGSTTIPVHSVAGFYIGQQATITDGVNREEVHVTGVYSGSITTTALTRSYKNNASISKSNAFVADEKIHFDTLNRFGIYDGRNLLRNSKRFLQGVPAFGIASSITSEGYLKVASDATNGNWLAYLLAPYDLEDEMTEGETVTISIEIKSPTLNTCPHLYIKPSMGYMTFDGIIGTEFSTVSQTRTWKKTGFIDFHFGFGAISGTTIIKSMMIQKGPLATAWTPHDDDL